MNVKSVSMTFVKWHHGNNVFVAVHGIRYSEGNIMQSKVG